jgi:hypothetical protein
MEFIIAIALTASLFGAALIGFNSGIYAKVETRETTINYCIEKPAECKKEYDFNKTKVEIQKIQEETKTQK